METTPYKSVRESLQQWSQRARWTPRAHRGPAGFHRLPFAQSQSFSQSRKSVTCSAANTSVLWARARLTINFGTSRALSSTALPGSALKRSAMLSSSLRGEIPVAAFQVSSSQAYSPNQPPAV